ncbi:hypothetical protein ON010_g12158 [Phytophthora cinnamomi]|nr:hypothetical protein ON010_g12158 [Phytophthora cinnamomi]
MAKHRKVCGKKKPPKTRKAINRDSYLRNREDILRGVTRVRAISSSRKGAQRTAQPLDVEPAEETYWQPLSDKNLLYAVCKDPHLFNYVISELSAKCESKFGQDLTEVTTKYRYRMAIFVLDPDKLHTAQDKFGDRLEKAFAYGCDTGKAFNVFWDGMTVDTKWKP